MSEMKQAKCVACGKDIMITKFGSLKTCKCEECKESNTPTNPQILSEMEVSTKKASPSAPSTGNTKPAKCCVCGEDFMVQKFASLSTAKCDKCKGVKSCDGGSYSSSGIVIDTSKVNYDMVTQNLEGYYIIPASIKNPKLRRVKCPACGHEYMKIVKLLDYSLSGIVATYQCSECFLICSVSEQCNHLMLPSAEHVMFNYRGEEIHELIPSLKDNKSKNIIDYLLKIISDNNIEITGIDTPRYIRNVDKPVSTGFNTTQEMEAILVEESDNKLEEDHGE